MQSGPTEFSPNSSSASLSESGRPSQHGVRHDTCATGVLLPDGSGSQHASTASQALGSGTDETRSQGSEDDTGEAWSGGVKAPATPRNRSPVDRIIEYENSSPVSPKSRAHDVQFKVIKRPSGSSQNSINLNDLPNGLYPACSTITSIIH